MNTCNNCEHYRNKEILGKDNATIKKNYCRRFQQELTSLKACSRFEEKEEPGTVWGFLAIFPLIFSFLLPLAVVVGIIEVGWKISFVWLLLTAVLSFVLFYLLLTIDDRKHKRSRGLSGGDQMKFSLMGILIVGMIYFMLKYFGWV